MGENYTVKTAMHYGSLSGISVFAFYMVLYFSGFNIFAPVNMLGIWIPVVFLVLSGRFHRNHNLGGFMTFGQGFQICFLTTVFSALLFGLAFYLFGTLYDSSLLDAYKDEATRNLEAGSTMFSEKFIDKAMESMEDVTMASVAFSESFAKFLGGTIVSLIIALILRRRNNTTPYPA